MILRAFDGFWNFEVTSFSISSLSAEVYKITTTHTHSSFSPLHSRPYVRLFLLFLSSFHALFRRFRSLFSVRLCVSAAHSHSLAQIDRQKPPNLDYEVRLSHPISTIFAPKYWFFKISSETAPKPKFSLKSTKNLIGKYPNFRAATFDLKPNAAL